VVEADGDRVTWTYDQTYQLLSEHRNGVSGYRHTFSYDPAGNRQTKDDGPGAPGVTTYSYDAANRLTYSVEGAARTTYTFDPAGNERSVEDPAGDRATTHRLCATSRRRGIRTLCADSARNGLSPVETAQRWHRQALPSPGRRPRPALHELFAGANSSCRAVGIELNTPTTPPDGGR
jgi:YD repeat-containing protein